MEPNNELSIVNDTSELDFTVDVTNELDLALDATCEMDLTTSFSLSAIDSQDSLPNYGVELTESFRDNDQCDKKTSEKETSKTGSGETRAEGVNKAEVEEKNEKMLENGNVKNGEKLHCENVLDVENKTKQNEVAKGFTEHHYYTDEIYKGDNDNHEVSNDISNININNSDKHGNSNDMCNGNIDENDKHEVSNDIYRRILDENDMHEISNDICIGDNDISNDICNGDIGVNKKYEASNDIGKGDAQPNAIEKTEMPSPVKDSGEKPSDENATSELKVSKIKKCRVKLPMKGEKFRVKFVDNFNVPHKLHLKNIDKVEKRKLNMLLAKKLLEPLTNMPMSRLKERTHVLVKFRKPAKLIRAQVKWIDGENKIEVQDIDTGALCLVTGQDIFVLDDEQLANIYPRLFVCTLSEFDGKDIFWGPLIRDLYVSTLRSGQISIEMRTFHHTVQTYDVHLKLLLDERKFINVNDWLANSLIPYLVYLKTSPMSQPQQLAKYPTEIFFPYVKLLKE